MKNGLIAILFLFPVFSHAGLFTITNRTNDCVGTLCDLLEAQVNANLPDADQSTYLNAMADSSVIAQKGLGADYASNMTVFAFGGGVGLGADLGDNSGLDLLNGKVDGNQVKGFGITAGLMMGLNLGLFGGKGFLSRTNLFLHFLSADAPKFDKNMNGEISSYGFHLQYKLVEGSGAGVGFFDWGGIDITTGVELSSTKISFKEAIKETVTSGPGTATVDGTATVGADISTTSIPLEISTNARLLYLLSIYGGLGADFNSGSAKSIANINTTVTLSGGATGGGDGNLSLGQEGSPSSVGLRNFIGLQLNLTALKAYVQVNNGMTDDTFGLSTGLRIVW